jgi:hypothetical protein
MAPRTAPLTATEQAQLQAYHQRYLAAGLATAPADRPRAEAALAAVYRRVGRDPVPVVWVASPLTASLLLAGLQGSPETALGGRLWASLWDSLGDSLRASLSASLSASLGASLSASLGDALAASLEAALGDRLGASLSASLGDALAASLEAALGDRLGASLWSSLGDALAASLAARLEDSLLPTTDGRAAVRPASTQWWGQMDLYWIAYYRYAQEVLGVRYAPEAQAGLDLLEEIGHACSWWYPREGLVIACDRPAVIQMEEHPARPGTYRLHATDGPAVRWRDGWTLYAWHGVRVPAALIETPSQITRADLLAERNAEVRRAMMERLGHDRFAALLDLVPVHEESWGGQTYTLLRTREPDAVARDCLQFVRVTCPSTGRVYHLCVPPTIRTAREAVAWTFGRAGDTYAPAVEQ